jgi:hypothetical protein
MARDRRAEATMPTPELMMRFSTIQPPKDHRGRHTPAGTGSHPGVDIKHLDHTGWTPATTTN